MTTYTWEVYGRMVGNLRPLLGNVTTQKKDVGLAQVEARKQFEEADSVWLVGEPFGGHIK